MSTKLMDNIDKEETAISFTDNIPRKEDMALVAAAKNGNRKAFEILVKRHQQRIFFVARRVTHTREDAEDVVQQSFQKAFTHLAHIRRQVCLFHLADAYRHHRSPHVNAQKSRAARNVDRQPKRE